MAGQCWREGLLIKAARQGQALQPGRLPQQRLDPCRWVGGWEGAEGELKARELPQEGTVPHCWQPQGAVINFQAAQLAVLCAGRQCCRHQLLQAGHVLDTSEVQVLHHATCWVAAIDAAAVQKGRTDLQRAVWHATDSP